MPTAVKEKEIVAPKLPDVTQYPSFVSGYRVNKYFIEFEDEGAKRDALIAFGDRTYNEWIVRGMDVEDLKLYCFFSNKTTLGPVPVLSRVLYQDVTGTWQLDFAQLRALMNMSEAKLRAKLYLLTWLGAILLLQRDNPAQFPLEYNTAIRSVMTEMHKRGQV